ncbi:LLM class flavin-dependent oxidoreductase [Euzebya tangerina]|uniref:LLM class flavin-dependent oxidoreductase n=1 Tax=Euzebya tangerina TaxID=591198 RepID=UPI0013C2ABE4|nr:LLM class flavin-dependent oxidoreductase [Euzebya tangerina]
MTSLGITINAPLDELPALAQRAEAGGVDALWVAETDRTAIIQAVVVAQATERVQVGTNISLAFPVAPAAQAMLAWDVGELSGGRFTMGLGSQVKRIITDRFGVEFSPAAARMREYVQAMRSTWAFHRGEPDAAFEGEHYHVRHPGVTGGGAAAGSELEIPVYVAAVGPLMVAGAAAVADGILGHPFTSDRYIEHVVQPRIAEGLEAADRDRADFKLAQGAMIAVSEDGTQAREWAKQQIAFYGTTPNYKGVFESYGDGHLTDELRAVFKADRGNVDALRAAVPESAVDRYAVAGTPDEVADQLASMSHLADHWVVGGPWYLMTPEEAEANLIATLDTLAPLA